MTIQIGDRIPNATFAQATAEGPKPVSTDDIFAGKTVALFAVPGAFTPTCSARHLPGFKDHLADIQGKGVDTVACISVNDAFVMKAWGESQGITDDSIVMLADGNGDLTREGLVAAVQVGVEVDYEGALPNSLVGGPPADVDRSVSINIPSEEAALGIETLLMGYVGPTAQAYDYSAPCSGS